MRFGCSSGSISCVNERVWNLFVAVLHCVYHQNSQEQLPAFSEVFTHRQLNRNKKNNQSMSDTLLMSATWSPSCYSSWIFFFFLERRLDYKIGKWFSLLYAVSDSVRREMNLDVWKKIKLFIFVFPKVCKLLSSVMLCPAFSSLSLSG